MANSDITALVVVGAKNGGNAKLANILETDQLPWAVTPECVFAQSVTWKDLRDATGVLQVDELVVGGTIVVGDHDITFTDARTGAEIVTLTHTVHEDTITIAGTASDGNYDAVFDAINVRARVVRSTTPATNDDIAQAMADEIQDMILTDLAGVVTAVQATDNVVTIVYEVGIETQTITTAETTATGTITATVGQDEDDVAAALEALIEAARGAELVAYVDDESVSTDTITVEYVAGVQVALTVDFPGTSTGTVAVTNVATIPIGTAVGDLIPGNVLIGGGCLGFNVSTAFAGITTIAATLGFSGSVDDYTTTTTIATAAMVQTIAATSFAERFVAAPAPLLTITADEPFANLTAGELQVLIPYVPPPTI